MNATKSETNNNAMLKESLIENGKLCAPATKHNYPLYPFYILSREIHIDLSAFPLYCRTIHVLTYDL